MDEGMDVEIKAIDYEKEIIKYFWCKTDLRYNVSIYVSLLLYFFLLFLSVPWIAGLSSF